MDERPIIIGGIGRSGSTFLQWLLTRHPDIHIYGQIDRLGLDLAHQWYQEALNGSNINLGANKDERRVHYDVAHYAGAEPDELRGAFRHAVRRVITGEPIESTRRWGIKGLSDE